MDRAQIFVTVTGVLEKVLRHKEFRLSDDTVARDIDGWDSLSHMMIISDLEKVFNIRFKLKELNQMKNMGLLVDLIQEKIA